MKPYQLTKLLVARTGLIIGSNTQGHLWVEIRLNGRLKRLITLVEPFHKRVIKEAKKNPYYGLQSQLGK